MLSSSPSFHSFINAEVYDYVLVGDETIYDNHSFSVNVFSSAETLHYSLQRNYTSFCDLHCRLTKKFLRSAFPTFPLEGLTQFKTHKAAKEGVAGKLVNKISRRFSTTSASDGSGSGVSGSEHNTNELRASILGDRPGATGSSPGGSSPLKNGVKVVDSSEMIAQKKEKLSHYLQGLFQMPEILVSDDLRTFLDDEAVDGKILIRRELSDTDVALVGEDPITATVAKEHDTSINATIGDILVWSFATKKMDIGFTITYSDGTIALPYQRYDSFSSTISGSLELVRPGPMTLAWDNGYSKFFSKKLTYLVKAVGKEEFDVYSRIAYEKGRERQRFEQQRVVLKRAMSAALRCLLASTGEGIAKTSIKSSDSLSMSAIEEEIVKLREDLLTSRALATELDTQLVEEREIATIAKEQAEQNSLAREVAESKYGHMVLDIAAAEARELELNSEKTHLNTELVKIRVAISAAREEIFALQTAKEESDIVLEETKNQLSKQKAEKKTLKAYALQLKSEEAERNTQIKDLKQKIASLDMNNNRLTEERDAISVIIESFKAATATSVDATTTTTSSSSGDSQQKESVMSTPLCGSAVSIGREVSSKSAKHQEEETSFNWDGEDAAVEADAEERDAICAYVLACPFSQRLLYLHNSVGF